MILSCPWCQKQLSIEESLVGQCVPCSGCGRDLSVPLPPDSAAAAPDLTHYLSPPQADGELGRLGSYRILKVLSSDGWGVVYQAEHLRLKGSLALKTIKPDLATSASVRERFFRQARLVACVQHEHIVRPLECSEEQGVPYLAMEFLQGETLEARLGRERKMPILEAVRIGKEIAEGLQAVHEGGFIHRNINLSNIWLEAPRQSVKILGFSLVRPVEHISERAHPGAIVGTPAFMSPEQARGEAVNAHSDLFSLGVILYRLSCGRLPFQGKDADSTRKAVATEEPLPIVVVNPKLPAELSNLVTQLLKKNPQHRPASAAVVVGTLQTLEGKLLRAEELRKQTPAQPASPKGGDFLRKRWLVVAIAAGLLVIAVLAGIVLLIRNQ